MHSVVPSKCESSGGEFGHSTATEECRRSLRWLAYCRRPVMSLGAGSRTVRIVVQNEILRDHASDRLPFAVGKYHGARELRADPVKRRQRQDPQPMIVGNAKRF